MSTKQSNKCVATAEERPTVIRLVKPAQSGSTPGPEPSGDFDNATAAWVSSGERHKSYGLLNAFDLIARRGSGEGAWAAPLGDDPIAFLLDSISDAATLWSADGTLLCRNRASAALGPLLFPPEAIYKGQGLVEMLSVRDRHYERRCLRCQMFAAEYVLDVLRELSHSTANRRAAPSQSKWPSSSPEELLATLAHEWRGSVHALTLNTEVMRTALVPGDNDLPGAQLLPRLDYQARVLRSMQQLMENLLDAQQREQSTQVLDLRALVIEVLRFDEDALQSAQCSYSLVAPAAVAGPWDPLQLRIAIGNLLSNAIKYGAGRPVEIRVGAHEERGFVCVTDRGRGVLPEDRERIFERFERASSTPSVKGYGLGLWLARTIARAHGGDVTLHSVPGQGATFELSLPRQR